MPAHAVPIDIKEQGVTWLLPPYSWSIRHIARKLDLSPSVIARWRLELVQQGLLPENENFSHNHRSGGRREPVIRRYAQHPVLVRRKHGSGGRTPAY